MKNQHPFDEHVRNQLLRFARRHAPGEAEDRAHDAMLSALEKQVRDPVQYAYGVIKNLARRAHRVPQRSFLASVQQPLPGSDVLLDSAQKFGRVDAALEQVLVWADSSATHLRVGSLTNLNVLRILAALRSSTSVFDVLPVSDRHQRRQRDEFEAHLVAAYRQCRCEVVTSLRSAAKPEVDPAPDEGAVETEADRGQSQTVACFEILDPCLDRAFWTVLRYGPREASFEDRLSLAYDAVQLAGRSLETTPIP